MHQRVAPALLTLRSLIYFDLLFSSPSTITSMDLRIPYYAQDFLIRTRHVLT